MSGTSDQPGQPGRSAGLTLNLSSNNPFRNRAASPNSLNNLSPPPPHSPFDDPPAEPARPVSRNPFLDPNQNPPIQRIASPDKMSAASDNKSPTAEELFGELTIKNETGVSQGSKPPAPNGARAPLNRPAGGPAKGENIPPRGRGQPPPGHRPSRSQEEAMKARRGPGNSSNGLNIFDSPQKRAERRPRRNSESSVMSAEKPMTEDEKKAREIRRRERERRHREGKDKSRQPSRKLDIIDQLDATSIYGTGLFHHDGPFDALNPHRNRKGSRRAPMSAFPEGSVNMVLGGSGPINKRPDHATFMGNSGGEAFEEFSGPRDGKDPNGYYPPGPADQRRKVVPVFDPLARGSILHGDESMGLGTSTFLEGTPAARAAIEKREAETVQETIETGMQRKKSLAHRIRNINRGPRDYPSGRMTNPEGLYGKRSGDLPTSNSIGPGERNPFFEEYDKGEELISVKRTDSNPVSPPGPSTGSAGRGYGLERRATTDTNSPEAQKQPGTGLLARVKSLKGGRRQRPEAPPSYAPPPAPGPSQAV